MAATSDIAVAPGKVTQIIGPVVDVEFPAGSLPNILTALTVTNKGIDDRQDNLTLEVAMHLGDNTVRTIAMDSTDGLLRGLSVKNTGKPIAMPVGEAALGRIMNVIGEPIDERGPVNGVRLDPIHRDPPRLVDQDNTVAAFETGIKVIDLLAPYQRGGTDCRDYTHTIYINGRPETARGTACRQPDGTWRTG